MVQNKPFVKIPYEILSHNVWELGPLHKATLFELFLRVNWKDGKSRNIDVKRGQLPCSYQWLADRVGVCRTKMVKILEDLEAVGVITKTAKNRSHLIITLKLFYAFENDEAGAQTSTLTSTQASTQTSTLDTLVNENDESSTQASTQASTQTSTRGEHSIRIEDKKTKESSVADAPSLPAAPEKPKKSTRFVPPSVEEVEAYCRERGNSVSAQCFVDFYSSKGWKVGNQSMKDWQACVRTWERRDGFKYNPKQAEEKTHQLSLFDSLNHADDDIIYEANYAQ